MNRDRREITLFWSCRDEVSCSALQHGDLPIYSIGAVERMLDIPAATIRNWEERYGLVKPERSNGGHRLYARAQVEQLRFVKEGVDRGLQPAEAHRLLGEQLERGSSGFRSADEREKLPRILVLLAERDPYAAEFAEFFLQTEGYEVALALDADDAALKFDQLLPHLAVIELLISGGGAELCKRLKEAGVPACLVLSTLDARDQALAAGADAFLLKPLDPLQFVSTVKDLLGKSAFLQRATSR